MQYCARIFEKIVSHRCDEFLDDLENLRLIEKGDWLEEESWRGATFGAAACFRRQSHAATRAAHFIVF